MISHIAKVLLRLYDGVEVAAISNVDNDLTESFDLCRQPLRVKETRNIGEPHFLDEAAFLSIGDVNLSGWSVDRQFSWLTRRNEAVLDTHRDGSDGSVAAHR
jgi:hypothetical protein